MHSDFAFLVHPRNTLRADMGILFGQPFSLVPEVIWRAALKHLPVPPMVTGKMSRTDLPGKVIGRIITVPLTPTQLLTMPRTQVQGRISAAIDKARDLGASVVGLGALTAPASVGGKAFAKRTDIGVTNGNAFTAAMTLQAIEKLIPTLNRDPPPAAWDPALPGFGHASIPAACCLWHATKPVCRRLPPMCAAMESKRPPARTWRTWPRPIWSCS